jgi:transposase
LDECRYDTQCKPGKIFYKKGFKNEIVRNGDKFNLNIFGFQTFNGNSLIEFKRRSKTFDMLMFLMEIRVRNGVNKENMGKLQLKINEYTNIVNTIRNEKFDKSTVKKSVIKKEIIEKKTQNFENALKSINNEEELNFDIDQASIIESIDLNIFEEEIADEKILKRKKFDNNKVQREKDVLYQILKEFQTKEYKDIFAEEKKIWIVLDNAKIHIAKLTKQIAEVLNIELIFIEPHASDLNPIERVWYSVKDKMSVTYVEDETYLINHFSDYFYFYANSETLNKKWIELGIT